MIMTLINEWSHRCSLRGSSKSAKYANRLVSGSIAAYFLVGCHHPSLAFHMRLPCWQLDFSYQMVIRYYCLEDSFPRASSSTFVWLISGLTDWLTLLHSLLLSENRIFDPFCVIQIWLPFDNYLLWSERYELSQISIAFAGLARVPFGCLKTDPSIVWSCMPTYIWRESMPTNEKMNRFLGDRGARIDVTSARRRS